MKYQKDKVSIIMPSYNHSRFISYSIESILNQDYENFDLIIIDDYSKDESRDIIREFQKKDKRIRPILRNKNGGEAVSRNDGLLHATGKYIAFCDSDDMWFKEKLKIQIEEFQRENNIGLFHSDSIIIDENGNATGKNFSDLFQKNNILHGNVFKNICLTNFINVPTVVIRKEIVEKCGLFETQFKYLTDWVYWIKCSKITSFFYQNITLAKYRLHQNSTNLNEKEYSYFRIKAFRYILSNFKDLAYNLRFKLYLKLIKENIIFGKSKIKYIENNKRRKL